MIRSTEASDQKTDILTKSDAIRSFLSGEVMSGGQSGIKGYLFQAMVCLLDSLDPQNDWMTVSIEPNESDEKVDICWMKDSGKKVVQVKHSGRSISYPDCERWAQELEKSTTAVEYELRLSGPITTNMAGVRQVGRVSIPAPEMLDPKSLLQQAAHVLNCHLARRTPPIVISPQTAEILVVVLCHELLVYSTSGGVVSKVQLESQIDKTVQHFLSNPSSSHRCPAQHRPYRSITSFCREVLSNDFFSYFTSTLSIDGSFCFLGAIGPGGIGKSSLVADIAERLLQETTLFPGGVLWTNTKSESTEDAVRRWIADIGDDSPCGDGEAAIVRFQELAAERKPLMVLDDAHDHDTDQIARLLVKAPGIGCIVISREELALPFGIPVIRIPPLSNDESIAFLRSLNDSILEGDSDSVSAICSVCSGYPLLLSIASKSWNFFPSLHAFAEDMRARGLLQLASYDIRATAVFDSSYESLSPEIKTLFEQLSQVPLSDISMSLASKPSGVDLQEAFSCLVALEQRSLLVRRSRPSKVDPVVRFEMHECIRDYATMRLGGRLEKVQNELVPIWCSFEFLQAEINAIGIYRVARQMAILSQWKEASNDCSFSEWSRFIRSQTHILAAMPEIFFQQTRNEPDSSVVCKAARSHEERENVVGIWCEKKWDDDDSSITCDVLTMHGHSDAISRVSFHPEKMLAISSSWDRTVRIWELVGGKCIRSFEGHTKLIRDVVVSPDGDVVVSCSDDKTIRVWSTDNGACIRVITVEGIGFHSLAFAAGGGMLLAGGDSGVVGSFDTVNWKWRVFDGAHRSGFVWGVAATGEGRRAVSVGMDGNIRVWNIGNGSCVRVIETGSPIFCVAVHPTENVVLVGGMTTTEVAFWSIARGDRIGALKGPSTGVMSISFSCDGRKVVTGSWDRSVRVWAYETREHISVFERHSNWVNSVAFSTDGKCVLSGAMDGVLHLWDWKKGAVYRSPRIHTELVYALAVHQRGFGLSGARDGRMLRWNVKSGESDFEYFGHTSGVEQIRISQDGEFAISTSLDGTARMWRVPTGECMGVLRGHKGHVGALDVDDAWRVAVTGGEDHSVRIWDLASFQCQRVLEGHSRHVVRVAVSCDAKCVISSAEDETVRIWDMATGECRVVLNAHSGGARTIAFSCDGRRVLTRDGSRTVRIWSIDGECLVTSVDGVDSDDLVDDFSVCDFRLERYVHWAMLRNTRKHQIVASVPIQASSSAVSDDGRYLMLGTVMGEVQCFEVHGI